MQEVPQTDGWKYDIEFAKADNLLDANTLIICSGGRDGMAADLLGTCVVGAEKSRTVSGRRVRSRADR